MSCSYSSTGRPRELPCTPPPCLPQVCWTRSLIHQSHLLSPWRHLAWLTRYTGVPIKRLKRNATLMPFQPCLLNNFLDMIILSGAGTVITVNATLFPS